MVSLLCGGAFVGMAVTIPRAQASTSPATVATLTDADARYYVRRLIRQRAGAGYGFPGSYAIRCDRYSRLRQICRFSAFAGDSSISGRGYVRYSHDDSDNQVHYFFRVEYFDDYCASVTHAGNCTRSVRWTN